jgi:hypothetical protein
MILDVRVFRMWPPMSRLLSCWHQREPSIAYLVGLWLVCFLLLLRSLWDSWSFPWYGNPDQDLVFLRDGIRLWTGTLPGYGDHPGLMQMVVVFLSAGFLTKLSALFTASWVFDLQQPGDTDWQALFVAAKSINVLLMSTLLALCGALLVRWLGRGGARYIN